MAGEALDGGWTYLTNHSHVLICIAERPNARLRDIATRVGITERAVQMILSDLEQAGVVEKRREGRRNRYVVHPDHALRHPVEQHRTVQDLLRIIVQQPMADE